MKVLWVLAALTCTGCDSPVERRQLEPDDAAATRDSVERLFRAIPEDLAADGPTAWLRHFEESPEFFMASSGSLIFPSSDSAETFVTDLSRRIVAIQLRWIDLRVVPVSPGVAVVRASFEETVTDTAGIGVGFGGYMTGVARRGNAGWRVQHLHWSSPLPEQE